MTAASFSAADNNEQPTSSHSAAIFSSEEEIIRALRLIFDTEHSLDICVDMKNPLSSIDLRLFKTLTSAAVGSGRMIRLVTEIDAHNADYCKSLLLQSPNNTQLRHLGDISGLMIVGEQTFVGTVAFEELSTARQMIASTSEKVLLHQKKIFNELWNIGVPAIVRLKEIESGETAGKHVLIQNPVSVEDTYILTVESAVSQILIMLPSVRAFQRHASLGIIDMLKRASARGIDVKMLIPANESVRHQLHQFDGAKNFKVHFIETDLNSRSAIIVVDRKVSLVIEIKSDFEETFRKAIGYATLSTVKSTVISYTSLFDSYWIHAGSFEKLQRSDRLKDEFINIAAHELRTPIMPIVGIVEVLMGQLNDPSQQNLRDDVEVIYRNADRLKRLAEDILNVSRIESGSFRLEIAECNVYDIITETIQEIKGGYAYWSKKRQIRGGLPNRPTAGKDSSSYATQIDLKPERDDPNSLYTMIMDIIGETGAAGGAPAREDIVVFTPHLKVTIENGEVQEKDIAGVSSHPKGLWIRCDPKKVKQALYNILSNALKFTDFGSGSKVFVGAVITEGGQVKLSVKDRGAGIDASIIDRLFERFATKSESGTGLGLYISKRIVEAHGGTISAENNIDGPGATFSFVLPFSPFSVLHFERAENLDRVSLLQKEIEDRRSSLSHMRTNALEKISEMKEKLLEARDRALQARDAAIEEYQKKVEASRGLLRVRQELLNEQINYKSMRREIDKRVERGLEGLTTVIETLKGDLIGEEALDKLILSNTYSDSVANEAQRIIGTDFFKSIQKQLGIRAPDQESVVTSEEAAPSPT